MIKRKCPSCAEKVERKFNYCPYCGVSFKASKNRNDFGMLGRNDFDNKIQEDLKLPFGIEKIMNSLISQLEKQMNNIDLGNEQGMPKGIKIRVSSGAPQVEQLMQEKKEKKIDAPVVSDEENERRMRLPKVEVESRVRRLADTIVYEIGAPGVKRKEDVVVTELASGLEIKAYSKNKCYVKFIPLKVEVVEYYVDKEKVFVELKS